MGCTCKQYSIYLYILYINDITYCVYILHDLTVDAPIEHQVLQVAPTSRNDVVLRTMSASTSSLGPPATWQALAMARRHGPGSRSSVRQSVGTETGNPTPKRWMNIWQWLDFCRLLLFLLFTI